MTDDTYQWHLDQAHRALTNARDRAQDFKEQRDRLRAELAARGDCQEMRRVLDALASAALALPDVVKTKALRAALSRYRRGQERAAASDAARLRMAENGLDGAISEETKTNAT